jgi:hypothetical protein
MAFVGSIVTGPRRDHVTGAPEYKVTAVRIERIDSSLELPTIG